MSFKKAVEKTPHLTAAWKPGLQALRARDKPHIEVEDTQRLAGSVNIDEALQSIQTNAYRWDYGIGYSHPKRSEECIYWVEIHTAIDKEVKKVLKKLLWLKDWLAGDGKALDHFEREFIWVSSGTTSFTSTSPQQKKFAQLGLQHKGRVLRITSPRS